MLSPAISLWHTQSFFGILKTMWRNSSDFLKRALSPSSLPFFFFLENRIRAKMCIWNAYFVCFAVIFHVCIYTNICIYWQLTFLFDLSLLHVNIEILFGVLRNCICYRIWPSGVCVHKGSQRALTFFNMFFYWVLSLWDKC